MELAALIGLYSAPYTPPKVYRIIKKQSTPLAATGFCNTAPGGKEVNNGQQ